MNAVDIKNLSFNYKGAFVFNNLNIEVEKGTFMTILGKGGSGKSTLFKILSGNLPFEGNVLILNKSIGYNIDKGYLGVISASSNYFKEKSVIDELTYVLKSKGRPLDKIKGEILKVSKKTGIDKILNYSIKDLNVKERILLMFTIQLLNKPKVLFLDNVFGYLDNEKNKIMTELKRLNKRCTIVNITNNTEECIYGKEVLILGDEVIKKKTDEISIEDFSSEGLELPFIVSLSSKLKFYNLINDVYLDMERLVDDLWQ